MLDLHSTSARIVFALVLGMIGLFLFFPIYWLAISAFKGNGELYRIVPTLFPHDATLEHFRPAVRRYARNSNIPEELHHAT